MSNNKQPAALAALLRWEGSGAAWKVRSRSADQVRVDLLSCTGGEVMETLTSSDPELLDYIGNRSSNED